MKLRLTLCTFILLCCSAAWAKDAPIAFAIHGGAGTIHKSTMTLAQQQAYRDKLKEAVTAGHKLLQEGGSSLDAIVAAIQILENSPLFNAGKGAVYTYNETHELDASIMDGSTRQAGAVAGVKHIANPIQLARLVMDKSPHVMLSGEGAEEFAKTQGIALVENDQFNTKGRYEALIRVKRKMRHAEQQNNNYQAAVNLLEHKYKMGTVGAVALDKYGNIAAGTSTGGMTNKRYGRIGDSPIIGAGTFADNASCAVSATGHGEYFIRYNVAADICARVRYQQQPIKLAAKEVIQNVLLPAGGTGGVIVLDTQGNITMPFNTDGMYRASINRDGELYIGLFKSD